MNDFYVYAWLKPCGTPFYIGKGRGRRDKVTARNNPIFSNILNKIKRSGEEPLVIRVHQDIAEDEAFELERSLIRQYGRKNNGTGILANLTDGGEGPSGAVVSEESRRKKSIAMSGVPKSAEHVEKVAAAQRGKKMSKKRHDKLMAAMRIMSDSAEWRENMTLANREPEKRAQIALARYKEAPRRAGFKGVWKNGTKWSATLTIDGKRQHLGTFATELQAAKAYDAAAFAAWGDNCYLNFGAPNQIH